MKRVKLRKRVDGKRVVLVYTSRDSLLARLFDPEVYRMAQLARAAVDAVVDQWQREHEYNRELAADTTWRRYWTLEERPPGANSELFA